MAIQGRRNFPGGTMKVLFLSLATLLYLTCSAQAETRALLIGVSDYDNSIGLADLKGPANDVALLKRVLGNRGVSDITVLADIGDGATSPTRANILAAFADLAATSKPGYFVYIHLSGHGTRQADQNGDETDGLDEVFLPSDTARAEPGAGVIPNAIVDDEIGRAVDAIRATGADVWLVMDSCHSGSGLRAASPGTAPRFVDPAVLGVQVTISDQAEPKVIGNQGAELPGGFLAFYAARSTEVAREVNFAEATGGNEWYGLFTSKLAARLDGNPGISFRQLFQAVLSDMADGSVPGVARLQTPLWEGTLIDAVVFGGSETIGLRRFGVMGDEILAGLVHGMGEGTLVGLVADAADGPEALIGYAQLEDVEATRAFLRAVDAGCVPSLASPCAATGPVPPDARFAQVVARPVDLVVRIAQPRDLVTGQTLADTDQIVTALTTAIAGANNSDTVRLELSETDYDVETIWDGAALWFGRVAVEGRTPVGLSWASGAPDLPGLLTRIAKAEILARMLGSVSGTGSILNASPVDVSANIRAVDVADLVPVGADVSPARECRRAQANAHAAAPLSGNDEIKQCDQIAFRAQGTVAGEFDVNRIHIDARYCVHADYSRIVDARAANRLGQDMTMCSDCPDGYAAGDERLFVIITESRANAEALNLEGLIENCDSDSGATRGAAISQASDFLTAIAQRPDTRGAFGGYDIANIWVEHFSWKVLPRAEAFARAGRPTD